ncbi:MAG: OmpA family protein, partial [Exilispira sp.]
QYFSSNKISNKTEVEFTIDISSTEDLQNLLIVIKDKDGKIIFTKEYKENIPKNFKWNGIDNDNKIVEDGIYSVIALTKYYNGNEPKSNEIIIIKDSILPQIEIKEQYLAFSPNDDGVQDTVTFELENDDTSKIVEIGIISEDGQKYLFPVDSIKNGKFIWDGKDSSGNDLKQGQYYLEVKAIDLAGNTGKIQSQKISLAKKAEEVSVNSDIYYYSPNNDSRNDIINFSCLAENSENVISMDLFIEDSKGKIVYSKNFTKFIQNIQFSEKLDEGQYFYYIKVFYNNGNSPISLKRSIMVDLTAPNIEITSENPYFTNKEPFSNIISFNYNISEKILSSTYSIVDQKKVKIIEKNIEVENGKIQWNGKINDKALPEGEYNLILISYDLAGNKSEKPFLFYLIQNTPKIKLLSKYDTISPNNDNLFDETEITIVNDGTKTLDKLISKKIVIKNYDNKAITSIEIPLNANSFLFTGNKLEDGIYKIYAILSYSSGIQDSAEIEVAVDKTPPKLDLVIKPELFSPDNDGEKDTLYITYSLNDFSDIESYTIRIYRLFEDGKKSVKPFKVFQVSKPYGKNIINQLQWDGKGDEPDLLVDSATDYQLVFTAIDKVGNEINVSQNFTVDILVMKTDLGYKIIINSIEFDLNSAVLKKSNYKILDLLIKKLLKFPDYKIIIIGFTDSTGDPNYNLILSERRAKAVYDYLIKNDIPKSRLEYKGMGIANPIDSNDTEEGRRRNRRVEFYLVKMNQ